MKKDKRTEQMKKVKVAIVHDELGRIVSVTRPSSGAKVTVLGGEGQSVFQTEVEQNHIPELVSGRYAVDVARKSLVDHASSQRGQKSTSS